MGRQVYNGKPTRDWVSKEDEASLAVATEALLLTSMVVHFIENQDIMSADILNAFIQAKLQKKEGDERVIMKITRKLVEWLVKLSPETYQEYVVKEKGKKVLYVEVLRAMYGMLEAAMLWYHKFRKKLEPIGFKFNKYDACVANCMVNGAQQTV